jgi:hypothetical protein
LGRKAEEVVDRKRSVIVAHDSHSGTGGESVRDREGVASEHVEKVGAEPGAVRVPQRGRRVAAAIWSDGAETEVSETVEKAVKGTRVVGESMEAKDKGCVGLARHSRAKLPA